MEKYGRSEIKIQFCYLLSVVHNTVVQRLGCTTINIATCFNPFGVIFRVVKYGIIQGTSMWLPTGSRGLQVLCGIVQGTSMWLPTISHDLQVLYGILQGTSLWLLTGSRR